MSVRNDEGGVRPSEPLADPARIVLVELAPVRRPIILDARHTEPDQGATPDHRGTVIPLRRLDRRRDSVVVVAIALLDMPAGARKTLHVVFRDRLPDHPVVGHLVVVVEDDQLAQLQVAGERDHLVRHTLHQAAVPHQRVGVVIDDGVAELGVQHPLRHRHADGIGDPLAQRPRGDLDPVFGLVFGMAGGMRTQHPEVLDLLHGHRLVSGEVQERVEEHRAVAVGLDEPIAVRPARHQRIELQMPAEQGGGDIRAAGRRPRVPILGAHQRVDGKHSNRIRHIPECDSHRVVPFLPYRLITSRSWVSPSSPPWSLGIGPASSGRRPAGL